MATGLFLLYKILGFSLLKIWLEMTDFSVSFLGFKTEIKSLVVPEDTAVHPAEQPVTGAVLAGGHGDALQSDEDLAVWRRC